MAEREHPKSKSRKVFTDQSGHLVQVSMKLSDMLNCSSLTHVESKNPSRGVEAEYLDPELFRVLHGDAGRQVDRQLERPAVADVGLVGRYPLAGHLGQMHHCEYKTIYLLRDKFNGIEKCFL